MVVGDLNACAAVQDHYEGSLLVARGLAEVFRVRKGSGESTAEGISEIG